MALLPGKKFDRRPQWVQPERIVMTPDEIMHMRARCKDCRDSGLMRGPENHIKMLLHAKPKFCRCDIGIWREKEYLWKNREEMGEIPF